MITPWITKSAVRTHPHQAQPTHATKFHFRGAVKSTIRAFHMRNNCIKIGPKNAKTTTGLPLLAVQLLSNHPIGGNLKTDFSRSKAHEKETRITWYPGPCASVWQAPAKWLSLFRDLP